MKINTLQFLSGLVLVLVLCSGTVLAQRPAIEKNQKKKPNRVAYRNYIYQKPFFEFGGQIGPSIAFTDVAPKTPQTQPSFLEFKVQDMRFVGGVYARYRMKPWLGLRSDINYAMLAGDDMHSLNAEVRSRQKSFNNQVFELSALTEIYFPNKIKAYGYNFYDFSFNYYLFGGLGVFYHDPKVKGPIIDEYDRVQQTSEYTYSNIQPVLPVGFGFYFNMSQKYTIGAELGMRITFFDYLDGFRRPYALRYDHYFFGTIRLGYILREGRTTPNIQIERQVFKPKSKD